jgi:hypothetical protein
MLRRVALLSVLAVSGALFGAAPALAQSVLKLAPNQPAESESPPEEELTGTLSASSNPLGFSAIPYTGSGTHGEGGQNETEEVTIADNGNAAVQVKTVRIVGVDASSFSVQWGNCENDYLSPGNTCTMGIRFEPVALGANHAQLEIASDSSSSPLAIALEGEGLHGPQISMSSRQALLGEVLIGSSTWQTFTLTNSGDYPLGVQQAFLVSGTPLMFPMLSDGCTGQVVMPGATCALTVGFRPTTPGEKDASILLITNSSLPVEVLGIDGVAVQPAAAAVTPQAPSPATTTSLSVTLAGQSAPVGQASITPPPRPAKVAAHARCKRRRACHKQAQRLAATRHKQRVSAVALRQP